MPLSLVSAPVLGYDLARHPNGPAVASILIRALQLQPDDLTRFNRPFPGTGPDRAACWDAIARAQSAAGLGSLRGSYLPRTTGPASSLSVLETMTDDLLRSMIVDLDDLRRLISEDILAWAGRSRLTEQATEVLLDAVAAQWVTGLWPDGAPSEYASALSARFRVMSAELGVRALEVGPAEDEVARTLDLLRRCTDTDRDRLRTVGAMNRASGSQWAEAVHEASWAAFTTGRIRAAALTQLLAVQAFRAGGFDATDGAEGLWNLVSGHLQACVMGDVLPELTVDTLSRAWHTAFPS